MVENSSNESLVDKNKDMDPEIDHIIGNTKAVFPIIGMHLNSQESQQNVSRYTVIHFNV